MHRVFARLVRIAFALSVVTSAILALIAPALIEAFFGRAFLPAAGVARVLIVASVGLSVNQVLSAGLKGLNQPMATGTSQLVALVVTIAALAIAVPPFGIIGAAIASCLAYSTCAAYMVAVVRHIGIPVHALFVPDRADVAWASSGLRRLFFRW
jgi:O-antigen/teichoic acid export membrane protein